MIINQTNNIVKNNTMTYAETLTIKTLDNPKELQDRDIKNLTSNNLVDKAYRQILRDGKTRDKVIDTAANIILKKGQEIKTQLKQNDLEASKEQSQGNNLNIQNNNQESIASTNQPEQNTTGDITGISGSTISQIIAKIIEILASRTDQDLQPEINNFANMIEVITDPKLQEKLNETMQFLAKDPILVVDIKDHLVETSASEIFDSAIKKYLTDEQKTHIEKVTKEQLEVRRQENKEKNKEDQKYLSR